MFGIFKKKEKEWTLGSPTSGKAVPLSKVNDPTFAEEMVGKGAAVIPADGKICAPADGKIEMVFPTLHAFGMTTDYGAELLIHVGLDTVNLNGDGFTSHIQLGDSVKKGDLLLEVDLEKLQRLGYDTVIPVLVTNHLDFTSVEGVSEKETAPGEDLVIIRK